MKDSIINVVIALSIAAVTFGLALVNTLHLIGNL
jgi:hypothetical protein